MREVERKVADVAKVDVGLMRMRLFQPLPRRGRSHARRQRFEEHLDHDGRRLHVLAPFIMGADDLSILLASLALGAGQRDSIKASDFGKDGCELLNGLKSTGDYASAEHLRVHTSLHVLCREAGLAANGSAYDRISASLLRLGMVSYADLGPTGAKTKSMEVSGQQLLWARVEEASRKVKIGLNVRFAAAILGGHHIRVDLVESRGLGEMARLQHFRLSERVRQGKSCKLSIDDLGEAVYGSVAGSDQQRLRRREEIRRGLAELGRLPGWFITEDRHKMVTVKRTGEQAKTAIQQAA